MSPSSVNGHGTGPATRVLALLPEQAHADAAALEEGAGPGFPVTLTHSLSSFLERLRGNDWLATVVSLSVDPVDEAVVARIAREPGVGSLLLAAPGASLARAILAERAGATGLIREPLAAADLRARFAGLSQEGDTVEFDPPGDHPSEASVPVLVGESAAMATVVERIARVARSEATVLLTGESGTGKEVVARAIHDVSERAEQPFVAVNCAAIPEHLLESELFGHEKGAFTGAVGARIGRFERANGGTLLLDEIGDMSMVLQAKLLRTLEERKVDPIGGAGPRPIDVRIIAATHCNLRGSVDTGTFREDLFYRLSVVDIHLPSLRDRGQDIGVLARYFGGIFSRKHARPVMGITERAMKALHDYAWPGNVRELRNVMDRAVLLANGPVVRSGHLRLGEAAPRASSRFAESAGHGYPPSFALEEVEADHIARVLAHADGHIGQASELLGIHRNTLSRKLQQYGIGPEPSRGDS